MSSKLRTQEADGTIRTHSRLGPSASLASQDSSQASEATALSDNTETDEWASTADVADDSDSDEAALSHLQRLQELSSTWKGTQVSCAVKQQHVNVQCKWMLALEQGFNQLKGAWGLTDTACILAATGMLLNHNVCAMDIQRD